KAIFEPRAKKRWKIDGLSGRLPGLASALAAAAVFQRPKPLIEGIDDVSYCTQRFGQIGQIAIVWLWRAVLLDHVGLPDASALGSPLRGSFLVGRSANTPQLFVRCSFCLG